MENGAYHQNGSGKKDEDELGVKPPDDALRQPRGEIAPKRSRKPVARGMWFGLTTNEVIGYSVTLMFFVLGVMVYLGALVPEWATTQYRNVLMTVMFLYGIYRGVVTYAKASQWRRRQAYEAQRDDEDALN
ncbi:MAG: hypothetical protein NZM06_08820 [Chloroherpetonaceae bacterium]|nr:hypothetical protein [Chloroherpetonaceae bacterium]MDW8436917.1 hypothetical protein [Chloroherpetonaceae bacterium]